MTDRPAWMDHGACRDHHPELWFADNKNAVAIAKEICADCPSLNACLQWALETNEQYGIWGGTSRDDRQKIQREAEVAA